jgi:hypothetical protein
MSKKNTSLQSIRISSIKHQLKALASQIEAIRTLDCEHHDGLDLGIDPELANIQQFSRRLASRVETIVIKSREKNVDSVRTLLGKIHDDVRYLSEHAGYFRKHAGNSAAAHLAEIIQITPDQVESGITQGSALVRAGASCFRAEVSQAETFEMQMKALIYLALEIAYFAGDEVGLTREEVSIQIKL